MTSPAPDGEKGNNKGERLIYAFVVRGTAMLAEWSSPTSS
jgi:hypothetical protein